MTVIPRIRFIAFSQRPVEHYLPSFTASGDDRLPFIIAVI
jgi:hypothetical protein